MTIEEIKKEWVGKEIFTGFSYDSDGEEYNDYMNEDTKKEVWKFFLPHLQPTEAVLREFVDYCSRGLDKAFAEKTYADESVNIYIIKEIMTAVKVFMTDEIPFYLAERGKK